MKGIQSFLGFCNFYRRFIPEFGRIAKPLINLTKAGVIFNFDSNCYLAFESLKNALTSAPVLKHFDPNRRTQMETDASDGVVAAVLSQEHDKKWHPVAFFLRQCNLPN